MVEITNLFKPTANQMELKKYPLKMWPLARHMIEQTGTRKPSNPVQGLGNSGIILKNDEM